MRGFRRLALLKKRPSKINRCFKDFHLRSTICIVTACDRSRGHRALNTSNISRHQLHLKTTEGSRQYCQGGILNTEGEHDIQDNSIAPVEILADVNFRNGHEEGEGDASIRNPSSSECSNVTSGQPASAGVLDASEERTGLDLMLTNLRSLLLEQKTTSKTILALLGGSAAQHSPTPQLSDRDKSFLSEAFRMALKYSYSGVAKSLDEIQIPSRILSIYSSNGWLTLSDWGDYLLAVSKPLYEKLHAIKEHDLGEGILHLFETHTLLQDAMETWQTFFQSSQQRKFRGKPPSTLWNWLFESPACAMNGLEDTDFASRLLAFAPQWKRGVDPNAEQLIVYSSLMTLASIFKWTEAASHLQSMAAGNREAAASERFTVGNFKRLRFSLMSEAELSFLFLLTHASMSKIPNLTILRVQLAHIGLSSKDGVIIRDMLESLKDFAPSFLKSQKEWHEQRLAAGASGGLLTSGQVKPISTMFLVAQAATSSEQLMLLWGTYGKLRRRYNKLALESIARAICQRLWDLKDHTLALAIWDSSPSLRSSIKLCEAALLHHYAADDIVAFEDAWNNRILIDEMPEKLWIKRVRIHFKKEKPEEAQKIFEEMVALSGENQLFHPRKPKPVAGEKSQSPLKMSIDMFHTVINQWSNRACFPMIKHNGNLLRHQRDIQFQRMTYIILFRAYLSNGRQPQALGFLKQMQRNDLGYAEVRDGSELLVWYLRNRRQLNFTFAAPSQILRAITLSLSIVFGDLVPRRWPRFRHHLSSDIADFGSECKDNDKPTSVLREDGTEQQLGGIESLREALSFNQSIVRLQAAYYAMLVAVLDRLPSPSNVRAAMVLYHHYHLVMRSSNAGTNEEGSRRPRDILRGHLQKALEARPWKEQLGHIRGDYFEASASSAKAPYNNFEFIDRYFAPTLIERDLNAAGLELTVTQKHRFNWRGFAQLDDQYLLNAGIIHARTRQHILQLVDRWRVEGDALTRPQPTRPSRRALPHKVLRLDLAATQVTP